MSVLQTPKDSVVATRIQIIMSSVLIFSSLHRVHDIHDFNFIQIHADLKRKKFTIHD
jgi:hypothetical protein